MHVFVTGGTGHIGSYVVPELIAAGHEVTGLASSDESAAAVSALGAKVRRDMNRLNGKTAVITGGATGIGLAAAKRFIEEGVFVFIFGRRQEALDAAVADLVRRSK